MPSTGPPCPGRSPSRTATPRSSRLGHAVSKPRAREPPGREKNRHSSSGSHCRISSARPGGDPPAGRSSRRHIDPEHGQQRRPEGQYDRRSPPRPRGRRSPAATTQSRSEIPSFDVAMDVDLSAIVGLRRDVVDLVEIVPSLNDFVVKATALALRDHPAFSSFRRRSVRATATCGTSVSPSRRRTRSSSPRCSTQTRRHCPARRSHADLAARARARKLLPDEIAASTPTVSNSDVRRTVVQRGDQPTAGRHPLQWVRSDARAVEVETGGATFRDVVTLTPTSDHRAVYGAHAARFLGSVRRLLEHPLALLLEPTDEGVMR